MRPLLTCSLFTSAAGFAALSYVREGESFVGGLGTFVDSGAWRNASPELLLLLIFGATIFAVAAFTARGIILRNRSVVIGLAAVTAAASAYGYDTCRDAGATWLPAIGGCHCWITAAAALLAAALTTGAMYLLGVLTLRMYFACTALFALFLHHDRRRPCSRLQRVLPHCTYQIAAVRLTAFRGPPPSFA